MCIGSLTLIFTRFAGTLQQWILISTNRVKIGVKEPIPNGFLFCPTLIKQTERLDILNTVSKASDCPVYLDAFSRVRAIWYGVIGQKHDLLLPYWLNGVAVSSSVGNTQLETPKLTGKCDDTSFYYQDQILATGLVLYYASDHKRLCLATHFMYQAGQLLRNITWCWIEKIAIFHYLSYYLVIISYSD